MTEEINDEVFRLKKRLEFVEAKAQGVHNQYKHLRYIIVDERFQDELRNKVLKDLFLAIEEIAK